MNKIETDLRGTENKLTASEDRKGRKNNIVGGNQKVQTTM